MKLWRLVSVLAVLAFPALADETGDLIGRPVFSNDGGRLGIVSDVLDGPDGQPQIAVMRLDPQREDSRSIPIPWIWVKPQRDAPVLVVPWNGALMSWLDQGSGDSRNSPVAR